MSPTLLHKSSIPKRNPRVPKFSTTTLSNSGEIDWNAFHMITKGKAMDRTRIASGLIERVVTRLLLSSVVNCQLSIVNRQLSIVNRTVRLIGDDERLTIDD